MFRRKHKNHNQIITTNNIAVMEKKYITLTGILMDVLRPGLPAQYLYNGYLIRTSAVREILEATPDYVRFETLNSIYTIAYEKLPEEVRAVA